MTTDKKEQLYRCADCEAEGVAHMHPISEFYVFNARPHKAEQGAAGHSYRYKNDQRRSQFCRRHTDIRTGARLKARLDPASPNYDAALHQRQTSAKKSYYDRKMRPESSEYDAELHQKHIQASRDWRAERRRKRQEQQGS